MQSIRWNEHSAHLTQSVSELYRNVNFTDCVLEVEDKSIHVHKVIVAASSPYFKKLLTIHKAIALIAIRDITYKDMKHILDFIYYGEVEIDIADVASLVKTAELLEIPSLKHCVSHCFGEEISWNDTEVRSMNKRCAVLPTNLIKHNGNHLLVYQDPRDPAIVYRREERLNSQSQNIQVLPMGGPLTKKLYDSPDVSGKDEQKSGLPNFKEMTEQEKENDELIPLTYVAVPPVLKIKESNEGHEDEKIFLDSVLKDPLGECTFQSELQVKNEPKEDDDIPYVTEGYPCEKLYDLEIKSESVCEIFGRDLKEENIFETGHILNLTLRDDTGTFPFEPKSECQPSADIDIHHKVNTKDCEISSAFALEIGNKTPGVHRSPTTQFELSGEGENLKQGTETNSSHIASLNPRKQNNNQLLVPRDASHLDPLEIRGEKGLAGRKQIHATPGRNYSCVNCRESFTQKSYLKRHMQTHSVNNTVHYKICKSSFKARHSLSVQKRMNAGNKPFQCDICGKSFKQIHHLKSHMRTHTGNKPFHCDICGKLFTKKEILKAHMRSHTGDKPFQCEICRKSFSFQQGLQTHVRIHTGDKPFQCEVCKKSFTQKATLYYHVRIHTGEKSFQCEICQLSFTRKQDLKRHIRLHTGEKTFECDRCQHSFRRKEHLKTHMQTHTRVKSFQCEICKSLFSTKSSLVRHKRNHLSRNNFEC